MAFLVNDCPRCGARNITLNAIPGVLVDREAFAPRRSIYEIPSTCRNCKRVVVWIAAFRVRTH